MATLLRLGLAGDDLPLMGDVLPGHIVPCPTKILESGIAGLRVELWDAASPVSGDRYGTTGADVDALRFHIKECLALELRTDGLPMLLPACPAGSCSLLDYGHRREWRGAAAPMIVFRLSRRALTTWAQANGQPGFDRLIYKSGTPFSDPVLANLATAMQRSLVDGGAAAPDFTAMIFDALLTYLTKKFGALDTTKLKGGLSGWQMRAVERLVADRMQSQVQLSDMAAVCGLSRSYFVTAFRVTTGVSPHQWVIGRRIERARELLRLLNLSLADVGTGCGFGDQSHFTRTFTRVVGMSPGAWRKQVATVERVTELSAKRANGSLAAFVR